MRAQQMVEPLLKDAVLRLGEVSGIEGRRVFVLVDRNKNSSDLLLDGEIVKNVAVGAYVEIRKGFLSIIGKAEGEKLQEDIGPGKAAVGGAYQSLDMRKTIPLLLGKNVYNGHKTEGNKKSLNIIVDEAHNILSKESFRETEEWKDYRLETFEEIIKEGRKFGVFVTIASQRPNDISETIISQAHNYFIHQLINQKDLFTIGKAVSYIDKITEESIPTLAVGTCIFSGVATPMPLKLRIRKLPLAEQPSSHTLQFSSLTANAADGD